MRSEHRVVKSFTFSLLNTLASYQDGKSYLQLKTDLMETLVDQLCSQSHLNALATLPQVQIPSRDASQDEHQSAIDECHSHTTLISVLFKFSQNRKSHEKLMRKTTELTHWLLLYVHMVCSLFTSGKHPLNPARNLPGGNMTLTTVPLAVMHTLENALGLL